MPDLIDTARKSERAVLVGLTTKGQSEVLTKEYLNELSFLATTAGAKCVGTFTQKLPVPDARTFVGSGKLQELIATVKALEADLAIFDDELNPVQIRNIEKALKCRILDRSGLILDIFAHRARTAHARTQVELAQYQYLLPRLTRMWTHLERQRGGIGLRGPGETEIETDRRIIRNKIALLKKKLAAIDKQKAAQRGNRGSLVRVALVGYTNVGKSTLMNLLSKSKVFAENKLFATLDTTVRKVVIGNLPFLLSDTVGFIRKLPHQLVASFKSTLDEVREADILIHIVDISHPASEEQVAVVKETLHDIGILDKPVIMVFNKCDRYPHQKDNHFDYTGNNMHPLNLRDLQATWMAVSDDPTLFISALKKEGIDALKKVIYREVRAIHTQRFPYNDFLYPDLPE